MSDPLAGTPYRAVRSLGRGGMGEVVEATRGAERVVVKLLYAHLARRPDDVDRMRLEAEVLGAVRHPNVVAVLDRGLTPAGRPYIVLERLEGRTLRDELDARGPLPPAEAISLAVQALAGLSAVHAAGVVHRDVKLENLFICDARSRHGRALKLLDLGVAKVLAGGRPAPLALPTAENVALGTPRWFSPEQASFVPVDVRADVYAMGLVLHALLTGRVPFEHIGDVAGLLSAHATTDLLPPSRLLPTPLDPRLDAVVMRAVAKRPEDRFPDARAFAEALSGILRSEARPRASVARVFVTWFVASLAISMTGTALFHIVFDR